MTQTFNGQVIVGLPNQHNTNLTYASPTGLTKEKLLTAMIEDEVVVESEIANIAKDNSWFSDLIQTGLLLRKQYFLQPLFTTNYTL